MRNSVGLLFVFFYYKSGIHPRGNDYAYLRQVCSAVDNHQLNLVCHGMGDASPPPPPPPPEDRPESAGSNLQEKEDESDRNQNQQASQQKSGQQPAQQQDSMPVAAAPGPTVAQAIAVAAPAQTGSTKKSPSDFLKTVLGRPVVVKLNSGIDYRGEGSQRLWGWFCCDGIGGKGLSQLYYTPVLMTFDGNEIIDEVLAF